MSAAVAAKLLGLLMASYIGEPACIATGAPAVQHCAVKYDAKVVFMDCTSIGHGHRVCFTKDAP